MSAKVGIFGGSFNPVHLGHVEIARELQNRFGFAPLWIVPSKNPPHKTPFEATEEDRLAMVELGFRDIPGAQVSRFELQSSGPSYAIHTIEHFRKAHPEAELFFILGSDAFRDIHQWYEFPKVLEACSYLVPTRAGVETNALEESLGALEKQGFLAKARAEPFFQTVFKTRTETRVCVFAGHAPEISSTEIRQRLKQGQPLEGFVPANVARYLKTKNVYGKSGIK